jgi:hypothetical protein
MFIGRNLRAEARRSVGLLQAGQETVRTLGAPHHLVAAAKPHAQRIFLQRHRTSPECPPVDSTREVLGPVYIKVAIRATMLLELAGHTGCYAKPLS